ncbi:MAG: hypothetical protein J6I36_07245 [Bacteroidaceae bacterium]|nr:hypothetical protein [Bacteroidaceae bacterium]
MELNDLLNSVTVDCKDNGMNFTTTYRLQAIEKLLSNTDYQLLYKGNLCYIYGKTQIRNLSVILVSSHVDCVYNHLFFQEINDQQMFKGTFDNSLTNACVLYDMIHKKMNDNVIVAFTGDEEENGGGVYEVIRTLRKWNTHVAMTIVLDITEEGWTQQQHFTIENDLGIDIVTGHIIVEKLDKYRNMFGYIHDSEPDESYDYDEEDIPCFSLCIPTLGDMHGEEGVLVRSASMLTYCSVLSDLANMSLENPSMMDRTYFLDYEDRGDYIKLYGIYVDKDKCKKDDYFAIKEHNGQFELPSMIHGKPVTEIADFEMMGNARSSVTIKTLIVPDSYKSLGKKNFSRWIYLESLVLYCDKSAIREWNFAYCDKLMTVECHSHSIYEYCKKLPLDHSEINYGCFDGCLNQLEFIEVT